MSLKLRQYVFSNAAFRKLPKREQRFFVRLALVSDDLRHLHHLILQSIVTMKVVTGIERDVGLHQLMFALRIYYGTLNESWKVIQTGWHRTKLSKKLHRALSSEAKLSLKALNRYFEKDNLTKTIRHNFAFHFADEPIKEALNCRPADKHDVFISGYDHANTFYVFAEHVRVCAIILKTGNVDMGNPKQVTNAIQKIYDEGFRISNHFTAFSDAVMVAIAERLKAKVEPFIPSLVGDLTRATPILFIDKESIRAIEQM
jgi:hypothetical protein